MSHNNDNFDKTNSGLGRTNPMGNQTGAGRTNQEFAGNTDNFGRTDNQFSSGTGATGTGRPGADLNDPANTRGFVSGDRSGNIDSNTFGGQTAHQLDAPLGTTTAGQNFDNTSNTTSSGLGGHTSGRGAGGDFDSQARPSGMGGVSASGPGSGTTADQYGSTGIRDSSDTDRFGSSGATTGTGSGGIGSQAGTAPGQKPGMGDKLVGGAQAMLGKVKNDPTLVEKGQERKMGGTTGTGTTGTNY